MLLLVIGKVGDLLVWLELVCWFQGEVCKLLGIWVIDGRLIMGWVFDVQGMYIVIWVDVDVLLCVVEIGGNGSQLCQIMYVLMDILIDLVMFSIVLLLGYCLMVLDVD